MKIQSLFFVLCSTGLIGATTAFAAPPAKVDICHNGGTYNVDTNEEEPIQFVINVSERSIPAHIHVHSDCPNIFTILGEGEECELQTDGVTVKCHTVTLCDCIDNPGGGSGDGPGDGNCDGPGDVIGGEPGTGQDS